LKERWNTIPPTLRPPLVLMVYYASKGRFSDDCRLITALIGAGAQIEATTEDGATPLLLAADMGHVKAAEILLNNGADLLHKDKEGWQAIHWAAQFGHLGILEYLCPKIVASIPLNQIKANDWTTPMHCAAEVGQLRVVKLLIKNGFEVAARNKKGQTPKILAQNNGYNNVVKALTEAEKKQERYF
jgi:ankyrin repeat protein